MPGFRRLDRYVLWTFLRAWLLVVAAAVLSYFLVDLLTRTTLISREGGSFFHRLARYYAVALPVFFYRAGPFVVLLAALFAVARMERAREVVAMLAAGVGVHRILWPILLAGALLAGVGSLGQELLIPRLADLADARRLERSRDRRGWALDLVPVRRSEGEGLVLVHAREFSPEDREASRVLLRVLDPGHHERAIWRVERLTWDGEAWRASEGTVERFDARGLPTGVEVVDEGRRVPLDRGPDELLLATRDPSQLSLGQLRRRVRAIPDDLALRMELWDRLAYPGATIVLLVLGVPLLIGRRERGPILAGLFACVVLASLFFVFAFFMKDLGTSGRVPPAAAALLPLTTFLGVGLFLMGRVRT